MAKRYRVIQWATGNVGGEALRAILEHPRARARGRARLLRGEGRARRGRALRRAADRRARDAGPRGDARASRPTACCYMPRHADLDEVCALLASGKNVVATPFLFYAARATRSRAREARARVRGGAELGARHRHPPGLRRHGAAARALRACPAASSGYTSRSARTGASTRARASRSTTCASAAPPEEATLAANPFARFNSRLFAQQITLLARRARRATLDGVTEQQELVAAEADCEITRRHASRRGTVSGQRYRWRGVVQRARRDRDRGALDGRPRLSRGLAAADATAGRSGSRASPRAQLHFMLAASFARRDALDRRARPRRRHRDRDARGERDRAALRGAAGHPHVLDLPLVRGSRALIQEGVRPQLKAAIQYTPRERLRL